MEHVGNLTDVRARHLEPASQSASPHRRDDQGRLFQRAAILAIATVVYNLIEGLVSTYFGATDESLALFGFGVDSFIELVSAIGIVHMVWRIARSGVQRRDEFEKRALRITGAAFYALTVALVAGAIVSFVQGHKPESGGWGIGISLVSIASMFALVRLKTNVGRALQSEAILADAACTRVCLYMSGVLLGSSLLYQVSGLGLADAIGAVGLAYYSWKEGAECFVKAKSDTFCSCH